MPIRALGFIVLQKLKEVVSYFWLGSTRFEERPTDRVVTNVSRPQPTIIITETLKADTRSTFFYNPLGYLSDATALGLTTPTAEIIASDLIQEIGEDVEPAPPHTLSEEFIENVTPPTAEPLATEFLSTEAYYSIGE